MGHNIDLQWLLDLPEKIRCPNCNNLTLHVFDEYDVDCGNPESKNGVISLDTCCDVCDKDFEYEVKISIPSVKVSEDFE